MSNIIQALKAELESKLQDAKEAKDMPAIEFINMNLESLEHFGYDYCRTCKRYHEESELVGDKFEDKQCGNCNAQVVNIRKDRKLHLSMISI